MKVDKGQMTAIVRTLTIAVDSFPELDNYTEGKKCSTGAGENHQNLIASPLESAHCSVERTDYLRRRND